MKSLTLASCRAQPITFYLKTPARSLVLLAKMPLRIAACHDLERVLPAAQGKLISILLNFYPPRTTYSVRLKRTWGFSLMEDRHIPDILISSG